MVFVDNFREIITKKSCFLSFNVLVDNRVLVVGWRLIKGFLFPPATQARGFKFYPVSYLTRPAAEELYEALLRREPELLQLFPNSYVALKAKDIAIEELLLTPGKIQRYLTSGFQE